MKEAAWIIAAVLTLGMGAIAGHEVEADRQDAEAIASRDWAAREVCEGRPFEWHGDVLICHRERP
jgi:hypothetical protein